MNPVAAAAMKLQIFQDVQVQDYKTSFSKKKGQKSKSNKRNKSPKNFAGSIIDHACL